MANIFLKLFGLIALGTAGWIAYCLLQTPPVPVLNPNEWWGPNELKGRVDHSIRPFKIKFEEQIIKDLKHRLKNHKEFQPPLEGVGFEYGFNTKQLNNWLSYWADQYQFNEREQFLNKFPHYKTWIQGLDIHFIRVKPQVSGVKVVPILLLHGWPGSIREFYEAIPLLIKRNPGYDFVFEVIAPSIPGYGFSDPAVRPGLGVAQTAVIFRNLMHRLGHKHYYIQGGDWGAAIGAYMSTMFSEDVLGFHTNMAVIMHQCGMIRTILASIYPPMIVDSNLADRMYPLSNTFAYILEEFGYMHLQATKPDTVGVSLSDSPAGLLTYILEKFAVWTRKDHKYKEDGGLSYRYSKEQLIDNLMMYWIPNSITTSMRFYAESMSKKHMALNMDSIPTPVPTWALQTKHEIMYQSPHVLRLKFTNLLNTTVLEDGGHFIAMELPEVYVEDVFRAVKAFMDWHQQARKIEL